MNNLERFKLSLVMFMGVGLIVGVAFGYLMGLSNNKGSNPFDGSKASCHVSTNDIGYRALIGLEFGRIAGCYVDNIK